MALTDFKSEDLKSRVENLESKIKYAYDFNSEYCKAIGKIQQTICGACAIISGQCYIAKEVSGSNWLQIGTITNAKPSDAINFLIAVFQPNVVGYGKLHADGRLMVYINGNFTATSQIYFNFSY